MIKLLKNLPVFILLLSVGIGAFFRLYQIGSNPHGFYVDEAALGYNAYSILKTGKDEFGKSFPIMFRSFTTFQSPVYTYLTIPFISIFGLNVFATRLPSAIFGILTIPILYLLVKKISPDKYSSSLAAISSLFLAISPWHILYSRTAYETNVALFFLVLGSWLFFVSLKKPWIFIFSSLSLATSFCAYRAETLTVPILVIALILRFYKPISSNLKATILPLIISMVLGLLIILPTLTIIRTPGFQARTSSLNIFSSSLQTPWGYKEGTSLLEKIGNNKQLLSVREFASLYSSYFSPRYMFSLGDSGPRKPYPGLATFFVWQFPLYLIGLYYLFKEKDLKHFRFYLLVLLFISPIPASLTRDPYSTLRALAMVIPQTLLVSFGLIKVLEFSIPYIEKFKYFLLILLLLFSVIRMFISVIYHHDYFRSQYWNFGWDMAVDQIKDLDPTLPIYVDDARSHPYILLLFFLKYDPASYQRDNFEVSSSEYYTNMTRNTIRQIGRITVKNVIWGTDTDQVEKYIIADGLAVSPQQITDHNLTLIDEIRYPGGEVAIRIVKTNPKTK